MPTWERWLPIRRNQYDPDKRAYHLVFAPAGTTLAELAGAAGLRWTIEECFHRAKDDLDEDEIAHRQRTGAMVKRPPTTALPSALSRPP